MHRLFRDLAFTRWNLIHHHAQLRSPVNVEIATLEWNWWFRSIPHTNSLLCCEEVVTSRDFHWLETQFY